MEHASKGIHPEFETQGRCHQKSKIGVSVAPKKDWYPPKKIKNECCMKKYAVAVIQFNRAKTTSLVALSQIYVTLQILALRWFAA